MDQLHAADHNTLNQTLLAASRVALG